MGARRGQERASVDLAVALRSMDGRELVLRDGVVLVETKTEDAQSRIDAELRDAGV
jgi:hypothetical protein